MSIIMLMTPITSKDWADHCNGRGEIRLRPANPDDFRFDIIEYPEPDLGVTHRVTMIDDKGRVIESFDTDDPYGAVEAARESQHYTLEERLEPYGLRWQQEQAR